VLVLGPRDRAVYDWERDFVFCHDTSRLDLRTAEVVMAHVWRDMGLLAPPKLRQDPRLRGAHGNRLEITVGKNVVHSLLFHEMAHSMDMSVEMSTATYGMRPEGESMETSTHDDNWLGLYVTMLDRYLGGRHFNKLWLLKTLTDRGLTMSYAPKPRCI
jgi:hypothetical protein